MIQRVGWRDNCRHNPACRSLNEHESRPAPAIQNELIQVNESSGAPDEMEFRTGYEMDGKGNLLKKPVLYHSADATFQPAPASGAFYGAGQGAEASGADAALYCLVCGRELASDQWVYCPDCGGRLRAALTPPPPVEPTLDVEVLAEAICPAVWKGQGRPCPEHRSAAAQYAREYAAILAARNE